MTRITLLAIIYGFIITVALAAGSKEDLKVSLSWGHESRRSTPYYIKLLVEGAGIQDIETHDIEPNDNVTGNVLTTHAGGSDIDSVDFTLRYTPRQIKTIGNLHSIWLDLIAHSDAETVRRLKQDPAYRPDSRKLTVQMDKTGIKGFSVTVDQMLKNKAFWIPSLGIYLTVGDSPISFTDHLKKLEAYKGKSILEQLRREPEATYEQYTERWEDMGNPAYENPHMVTPGHIVGITWDSALHKFGIDRKGMQEFWKEQKLENGLPVITTTIEQDGLCYEVEQFAYPLNGPPKERRGDIAMVLLQKVRITNLQDHTRNVSVNMHHRREFASTEPSKIIWRSKDNAFVFEESVSHKIFYAVEGSGLKQDPEQPDDKKKTRWKNFETVLTFDLTKNANQEFVVKLPSPMLLPQDRDKLINLNFVKSREATLKFWADYVSLGAQFQVPEKVVNDLYRANLWHALRLPRRHGGKDEGVKIDLPYSNFAYDQHGTPWPVNQAVYVDYMIYGLRGYNDIAKDELLTMYRNNQQPDGCISGYANWGVYTPSMVYVVAKNYLLSGDRDMLSRIRD
ncbi:MAG: hypothetical protein AMJ75_09165 [Phycisphaerae bacterium SM1_79]|nr:MAG: hypothetical protein AMJ75_09165 [Phycisphaerae bacterium SM1_79]